MKPERRCKPSSSSSINKKDRFDESTSKSSKNSSHFPMSERQQFALLKQMETQTNRDESDSPHSIKDSPKIMYNGISSTSSNSSSCSISSKSSAISKRIEEKKKIYKRNSTGETILIKMAKKGDFNNIKALIKEGSNVNEQDYAGWSALHECSIRNYTNIVVYLLKHKANPNLTGGKGDTALHDAARLGHIKVVKYLLRYGANPMLKNENNQTPLDIATNKEVISILQRFSNPDRKRDQNYDDISENFSEDTSVTDIECLEKPLSSLTKKNTDNENINLKQKKDPYAFEEDEFDLNDESTKPLSVSLSSNPLTKSELSPIAPPLRLRFAKESGCYQLKDKKIHGEDPLLDSADEKPVKTSNSDDENCEKKEDTPGSFSHQEDESQKVPPLIIKLGTPDSTNDAASNNEETVKPKEEDTQSNGGDKKKCETAQSAAQCPTSNNQSGNNSTQDPANTGQQQFHPAATTTSAMASTSSSTSLAPSSYNPQRTTKYQSSSSSSSSSNRREGRSGRTLRSHTAALREKENKDVKGKVYSSNGPPKKRRIQNSKSDSYDNLYNPSQLVGNFGSQDSCHNSHDLSFNQTLDNTNDSGEEDHNASEDGYNGHNYNTSIDIYSQEHSNLEYPQNPYERALLLEKEKSMIISQFKTMKPMNPADADKFSVNKKSYLLADNLPKSITMRPVPSNLHDLAFVELFKQQENERYLLQLKHLSERQSIQISAEQSIIRLHQRLGFEAEGNSTQISYCNLINVLDIGNIPNIYQNLKQAHDSIRNYQNQIYTKREEAKQFDESLREIIDRFETEKRKTLSRQLHESDAMMMVQKLDWEMKSKELLNINTPFDNMTMFKDIPSQHVPPIFVPDNFDILPKEFFKN